MHPWITIGDTSIPTFLVLQVMNANLLMVWAFFRARRRQLDTRQILDVSILLLVSGLVGGRLLHVIWEAPGFYWNNPAAMFYLSSGGFVYLGGFMSALVAGLLYLRLMKIPNRGEWLDFFTPLLSLGTAIGRVGCFLAGCCYGTATTLPWAVPITDERGWVFTRHPTSLYLSLWEFAVFFFLLKFEKSGIPRAKGALFFSWLILHGAGRFFVEFIRDDFRGPFIGPLSLSQAGSVVMVAVGFFFMLRPPQSVSK